jgi:hypothetical protein
MTWVTAALTSLLLVGFGGGGLLGQLQVRFEGYLKGDRAQIHPLEDITIRIGEGSLETFALTNIVMLSPGDVSGTDVLDQMTPVKPSFIFAGDEELLKEISTAQPNQLLKVTGYTSYGSQWVLVETVERSAPITGPTPTPSLRERFLGF